jgi:amidohydrolase
VPSISPRLAPVLAALAVASLAVAALAPAALRAQAAPAAVSPRAAAALAAVAPKVVAWRRDLHQHPELSNQETRTSALVAAHLRALGIETRTGVGVHGVIGVLRGGRPGRPSPCAPTWTGSR